MASQPTHISMGQPETKLLSLVLVLVLAVALLVPGTVAAAHPPADAPEVRLQLAFSGQPADSEPAPQRITTAPFGEGGAIVVSVAVDQDTVDAVIAHHEHRLHAALKEDVREANGGSLTSDLRTAIKAAVADAGVGAAVTDAVDVALAELEVEIALGRFPAGAADSLGGTRTAPVVDGVAEFVDLAIDQPGRGFTLEAAVADVPLALGDLVTGVVVVAYTEVFAIAEGAEADLTADAAESRRFRIWENVSPCGAASCQANLLAGGFSANAHGTAGGGFFGLDATTEELSPEGQCGGTSYRGLPGAVVFDAIANDGSKSMVFLIDRDKVQEVRNDGKAHYDLCYVGDAPFQTKAGTMAPIDPDLLAAEGIDPTEFEDAAALHEEIAELNALVFGPALLPDCKTVADVPPCVAARTGAPGGAARIVVELPAGDPWMR